MRATSQGFESLLLRQRVPRLQFRSEALFYYRVFTRVTRGFTPKAPASASHAIPRRGTFFTQVFTHVTRGFTPTPQVSASHAVPRRGAFLLQGFHPRYTRLHAESASECLARNSAANASCVLLLSRLSAPPQRKGSSRNLDKRYKIRTGYMRYHYANYFYHSKQSNNNTQTEFCCLRFHFACSSFPSLIHFSHK